MINVAINGFGRIGKKILRTYLDSKELQQKINIVAINDLTDIETSMHLLKYDSVHGKLKQEVKIDKGLSFKFEKKEMRVKYLSERNPEDLHWNVLNIDVVLECTGLFTSKVAASAHITAGAKKVIISAPGKGVDATIVFGVNEETLTKNDKIISNASCTTNCLAPVLSALDSKVEILSGIMTTIHAYTGDQNIVDGPHSDVYRARGGALSMIPTKTGAAEAIEHVIPKLKGKLKGMAIRVPTPNVSVVDLSCVVKTDKVLDKEAVNNIIKGYIETNNMEKILSYSEEKCVSIDYNGEEYSSIFDANQTTVVQIDDNLFQIKICSWYDNESGFSRRMLDLTEYLSIVK